MLESFWNGFVHHFSQITPAHREGLRETATEQMLLGWDLLTDSEKARIRESITTGRIEAGPWQLEIHPTNRCNLDCRFCSSRPHRHSESLEWSLIEQTLLRGAREGNLRFLRLSGGGESLVWKHAPDLLRLTKDLGLVIADLTTNGVSLREMAGPVVDAGTRLVCVSLNEWEPEAYSQAMGVPETTFHRVLEGVRLLNDLRTDAAGNFLKLHLKFFIHSGNWREIEDALKLGVDLGADRIMLNSLYGLSPSERVPAQDLPELRQRLEALIAEDCRSGRCRLGFDLQGEGAALHNFAVGRQAELLPPGTDLMPGLVRHDEKRVEFCYMGWFGVVIAADGNVYPCCNFVGSPEKSLGNINAQPLEAIWQGEAAARLRREFRRLALLDGNVCHSCRLDAFLEPQCIDRRGCPFGYYLCDADFYRRTAAELHARAHPWERPIGQARDHLVQGLQKLAAMARRARGR